MGTRERPGHTGLWPWYRTDPRSYPSFPASEFILDGWPGGTVESVQALWDMAGIGSARTLTAWGRRSLIHLWTEMDLPHHSIPSRMCADFLKFDGTGGKWSTQRTDRGEEGREGQQFDVQSAWPSHHLIVPCGTATMLYGEKDGYWTWFMRCRVDIPWELPLGPFPWRDARGGLSFPTKVGTYETRLWMEQAEDCRAAGCTVEPSWGFAWKRSTDDTSHWAQWMMELRERSPGGRNGLVGKLVKQAANKTIGYHGMGRKYQKEVKSSRYQDGDMPTVKGGRMADTNLRWFEGRGTMVHWQRYTEMALSRTMYAMGLPWAMEGRLISLWADQMEVAA